MRTIRLFLAFLIVAIPAALFGQMGIRVTVGPPMLPVYEQPLCPGDGYLWTPGYWGYNEEVSDYYWVPGTWVQAPEAGMLWTPGYWGSRDGGYYFNEGYWGEHVGFYGGVHYGFGYYGDGYRGGRWQNGHFFYNRSESHVDEVNFHNVYNERVEHGAEIRVSFNGGSGGIERRANAEEEAVGRERHVAAVTEQKEHERSARENPEFRASSNHGNPRITATSKPGEFGAHAESSTKSAEESKRAEGDHADAAHAPVHPKELAPRARPAPANSGNAAKDKQYEQKQDQLIANQNQEREKLQQKQESEHQRAKNADTQKLEQAHQRQTQQMSQKHESQQQKLQSRQPQAKPSKQPSHPDEKP